LRKFEVKSAFPIALLLACSLGAGPRLLAQAAPAAGSPNSSPSKPNSTGSGGQNKPADANPFPEDESNVPVMPSKDTPDLAPGTFSGDGNNVATLPAGDTDPVPSLDDAAPAASSSGTASGFSSSNSGIDSLLPGPDDEQPTKRGRGKQEQEVPEHHETAAEDENVGRYYLDSKNWHAALSRFQSAMVLDPENPDVYWGMAESDRHLGNYAEARANYLKDGVRPRQPPRQGCGKGAEGARSGQRKRRQRRSIRRENRAINAKNTLNLALCCLFGNGVEFV
jgi:tetratricopeptide (TPR) repeat protein